MDGNEEGLTSSTHDRMLTSCELEQLEAEFRAASKEDLSQLDRVMARLADVRSEDAPARLVRLLIETAVLYYLDGRYVRKAHAPLLRAISVAETTGDRDQLRRSLSLQGLVLSTMRDTAQALGSLLSALEISEALNDEEAVATTWSNIAIVFVEASLYVDARACFQRAERFARGLGDAKKLCYIRSHILHGSAVCSLFLQDFERGSKECREAIDLIGAPADREAEQVLSLVETTLAQLFLEMEMPDAAELHAAEAQKIAERSGAIRALVAARAAQALLEAYGGNVDAAMSLIASVTESARQICPSSYFEVLRVSVKVNEISGQPDAALSCLQEVMGLNRHAARSLLQVKHERLAGLMSGKAACPEIDVSVAAKAAELERTISDCFSRLTSAAITTSLRCNHDQWRVFRMGKLARLFARSEGWSQERSEAVSVGARWCDIGMMVVPDALLQKRRGLSLGERKIVEDHTRVGAELLTQGRLAFLQMAVPIARFHHERWDGTGPWQLARELIPAEARLVALCDVFDAITHSRPWRSADSIQVALRVISIGAGTHFDPLLSSRFVQFVREEYWKHDDWESFLREDARDDPYVRTLEQISEWTKDPPNGRDRGL